MSIEELISRWNGCHLKYVKQFQHGVRSLEAGKKVTPNEKQVFM